MRGTFSQDLKEVGEPVMSSSGGKGKPRGGKRPRMQSRKSKAREVGARGKEAGERAGGIAGPGSAVDSPLS